MSFCFAFILELNKGDEVIDFFCGLDNFTLPIAKYVRHAVGVEGSSGLIERAKINAKQNDIQNVDFYKADLFKEVTGFEWFRGEIYNKAITSSPLLSSSKSITNNTIF
jgi:23S rRNA (uracil1939-C5)-methyltransferase